MLNKLKSLRESREEGFTLIELLVVIVIIGVLAAIALPIFLNQQKEAQHADTKANVRRAMVAVQTYLVKNPTATDVGTTGPASGPISQAGTAGNGQISILAGNFRVADLGAGVGVSGAKASWDNWAVIGLNSYDFDDKYYYAYTSKTGKYTEGTAE